MMILPIKEREFSKYERYAIALGLVLIDCALSLFWTYVLLVILGQSALRPIRASTAAFFKAYFGGPAMLVIAAAWVGFCIWIVETYFRIRSVRRLLRRALGVTAVLVLLFPLFHVVLVIGTARIFLSDWLVGIGGILVAGILWLIRCRLS